LSADCMQRQLTETATVLPSVLSVTECNKCYHSCHNRRAFAVPMVHGQQRSALHIHPSIPIHPPTHPNPLPHFAYSHPALPSTADHLNVMPQAACIPTRQNRNMVAQQAPSRSYPVQVLSAIVVHVRGSGYVCKN
jgi:hypothetical protein